jgi:hypothetical protein
MEDLYANVKNKKWLNQEKASLLLRRAKFAKAFRKAFFPSALIRLHNKPLRN